MFTMWLSHVYLKCAVANSAIKLGYVNGHFGYFYKMNLLSNGFNVPLYIHFLEDDFYNALPIEFNTLTTKSTLLTTLPCVLCWIPFIIG